MKLTLSILKQLKATGKIRDFETPIRTPVKTSKAKERFMRELHTWCQDHDLELKTEYQFAKPRKWRFDGAIKAMMTAVEYEGIFSEKSRHTTMKGYSGDVEKYTEAAKLGWRVLRYTAKTVGNLINDLNEIYNDCRKNIARG